MGECFPLCHSLTLKEEKKNVYTHTYFSVPIYIYMYIFYSSRDILYKSVCTRLKKYTHGKDSKLHIVFMHLGLCI